MTFATSLHMYCKNYANFKGCDIISVTDTLFLYLCGC